jgi:hypothetical protein
LAAAILQGVAAAILGLGAAFLLVLGALMEMMVVVCVLVKRKFVVRGVMDSFKFRNLRVQPSD